MKQKKNDDLYSNIQYLTLVLFTCISTVLHVVLLVQPQPDGGQQPHTERTTTHSRLGPLRTAIQ